MVKPHVQMCSYFLIVQCIVDAVIRVWLVHLLNQLTFDDLQTLEHRY